MSKEVLTATMDGNEAAAYASYAFTEVAAIYPITPSSPMAAHIDDWAARGKKNIFGKPVKLVEMQSEAGAISAVHGAMEAGALTSTYTSSQGLLLMVPVMHRIAGQMKPGVIHVASRSVALHAYSIFAEHSDVMACRHTGYALLASSSVQEAMDLGAVAHLASIKSSLPFLHFFDGFRTSHEIQKIECLDYEELAKLVDYDALNDFRRKALNPEHPLIRNSGQTPEIYFQSREASNPLYERLPGIVEEYMDRLGELTGRRYRLFEYYGAADAETVVIAMGSAAGAIRETVDYLNSQGGKVGFIEVHLYRPFSNAHFMEALPESVKKLVVLDRTKENGAQADPLYADICATVADSARSIRVLGGRYGLGGKDTDPALIMAVFENAAKEQPMNHFTVGIEDDLTHHSLPVTRSIDLAPPGQVSCKFWGLGSDGTVSANKNSIKIIGEHTDMFVQAYFEYDGKKFGGVTKSHLRFGHQPIQASYYVRHADFVACHQPVYMQKYDMHSELKPGGAFLLNCGWTPEEMEMRLPAAFKRYAAENRIRFYTIDATSIAQELGMGSRTNTILQSAFFSIVGVIPREDAVQYMKDFAGKSYGHRGEEVVQKNYAAIERGVSDLREIRIPDAWKNAADEPSAPADSADSGYVRDIMRPILAQKGSSLPVSVFEPWADGSMPSGTSRYEKRGIAVNVPQWDAGRCIQCNLCSYVCPHAAIRPFLLSEKERAAAPAGTETVAASGKGMESWGFRIQVDILDCVGCGSCANVCPAREPALTMRPLETQREETGRWDYMMTLPERNPYGTQSVKGSQFEKPLLEFPGACPGCGETPYVKLATQLFGDRMYIATAPGCSLVWATDYPSGPYTVNSEGRGPAMSNSLFENNGEFGFGMALGVEELRDSLKIAAERVVAAAGGSALADAGRSWLDSFEDGSRTNEASAAFRNELENAPADAPCAAEREMLLKNAEHLTKKSVWILGGDGWAYDIGYGGLDHVLAMGKDVNVLVLDTEVYSNTGGQASKATPKGAVAQFAAAGRRSRKKDLAMMAMSYENVYVAQVCMGADPAQLLRAMKEAEAYHGTSLIIAYAPCQSHGLKAGMGMVQAEMKKAVASGYWTLFRYDPQRRTEGKNPFMLDSKEPGRSIRDFMAGEVRFASLEKSFPEAAAQLAAEAETESAERYRKYKRMAE